MTGQANEDMAHCMRHGDYYSGLPSCPTCAALADPPSARPVVSPPDSTEVREAIRLKLLEAANNTTDDNDTFADGFFNGLHAAMQALDTLAASPPSPQLAETLREEADRARATALEQRTAMSSYAEFWRGREGAFIDVLAWLDDHALASVAVGQPENTEAR